MTEWIRPGNDAARSVMEHRCPVQEWVGHANQVRKVIRELSCILQGVRNRRYQANTVVAKCGSVTQWIIKPQDLDITRIRPGKNPCSCRYIFDCIERRKPQGQALNCEPISVSRVCDGPTTRSSRHPIWGTLGLHSLANLWCQFWCQFGWYSPASACGVMR